MSPERIDGRLRQVHAAPALGGLGLGQFQLAVHFLERLANGYGASLEVHVLPLQPEDLAKAQARTDCQNVEGVKTIVL